MVELLFNAVTALGIYSGLVVIYTLLGAYGNINLWKVSWNWRTWLNGITKYMVLGLSVLGTFVASYALMKQAPLWGVQIANIEAVSTKTLFALLAIGSAVMLGKIVKKLALILGVDEKTLGKVQEASLRSVEQGSEQLILQVEDLPQVSEEYIKKKIQLEAEGGRGAVFSVPIGSYDAFRAAVLGRSFDIDGAYGAQCWDGAALLWQQIGRTLSTGGTGAAKGTWTHARDYNAGGDFTVITNPAEVRRGDVIVFGGGRWGHIGFADSDAAGGSVAVLGQNQVGNGNGAPFNIVRMGLGGFIGAFRFKRWVIAPPAPKKPVESASRPNSTTPAPAPTPTVPNNPPAEAEIKVGDTVIATGSGTADSYGNGHRTMEYPPTPMKVIGINNGMYALNQYNQGTPGVVADVTGWWSRNQIRLP